MRARVEGRHSPRIDRIAGWISGAGAPRILYGVAAGSALLLLWRRGWRYAAGTGLVPLLAWGLHNGAKNFFERVRPPGGLAHDSSSFPSGHATTSAAVFVMVAYALWRERLLPSSAAVVLGAAPPVLIAWSRVRVDDHWATDVLAGWCLGLAVAGLCGLLHRRLVRAHERRGMARD